MAAVVSVLEGRGDAAGGRRTSGRCRIVGTTGQARKAIKVLQEPKPVGNRERIHCAADAACIVRDGLATRARSITIWQRPCRMNLAASASQGLASSKSGQGGGSGWELRRRDMTAFGGVERRICSPNLLRGTEIIAFCTNVRKPVRGQTRAVR